MATTITDLAPKIELLTGAVLAPGNAVHAIGWFRRIDLPETRPVRDGVGPIRAWLAASNLTTAQPLVTSLRVAGALLNAEDGKWSLAFASTLITPFVCNQLKPGQPVYLHIVQDGTSHTVVELTFQPAKAAVQ